MSVEIKKGVTEASVLYLLLTVYTIVYLGLMVGDFIAREMFDLPSGMMAVYIALVGAYAADKEIRRWLGKEEPSRRGTIFVYLWMVFFLVAFVVHSFLRDFTLPTDLNKVALQVLGVFFSSKASKKIYELKTGKGEEARTREETVLQLIKDHGKVARKEIVDLLKLSNSTVGRLLAEMEKKGLVMQVGDHKGAYYHLAN